MSEFVWEWQWFVWECMAVICMGVAALFRVDGGSRFCGFTGAGTAPPTTADRMREAAQEKEEGGLAERVEGQVPTNCR